MKKFEPITIELKTIEEAIVMKAFTCMDSKERLKLLQSYYGGGDREDYIKCLNSIKPPSLNDIFYDLPYSIITDFKVDLAPKKIGCREVKYNQEDKKVVFSSPSGEDYELTEDQLKAMLDKLGKD